MCLAAEQTAYIARTDLRDIKSYGRERRRVVSGECGGDKKEASGDDRRKRIEESKKKTTCRVCGQLGHWAGDPECTEEETAPSRGKGFGRDNRHAGKKGGKGRHGKGSRFGCETRTSYFAVCDESEEKDVVSFMAIRGGDQGEKRDRPLEDGQMEVDTGAAAASRSAASASAGATYPGLNVLRERVSFRWCRVRLS